MIASKSVRRALSLAFHAPPSALLWMVAMVGILPAKRSMRFYQTLIEVR
jgi:hypothetical protein